MVVVSVQFFRLNWPGLVATPIAIALALIVERHGRQYTYSFAEDCPAE